MKRKNNKRIIENSEEYPSILSVTPDVTHTFGKNEEVEKYEYEVDDNKEEVVCYLLMSLFRNTTKLWCT